jgi:hypothetical protein
LQIFGKISYPPNGADLSGYCIRGGKDNGGCGGVFKGAELLILQEKVLFVSIVFIITKNGEISLQNFLTKTVWG